MSFKILIVRLLLTVIRFHYEDRKESGDFASNGLVKDATRFIEDEKRKSF